MSIIDEKWIDDIWCKIKQKTKLTSLRMREQMPGVCTDGKYNDSSDYLPCWTNGFWGGLNWLMYSATGDEVYKETAQFQEKWLDELFGQADRTDHDVGFLWNILSGASYKITGDLKSKNRNILAANILAGRYNPVGGYIRAWNAPEREGCTIIDCMMNIPLLYWASKEIGDNRYKNIAINHANKTMEYHIRPDGSVNHVCHFDTETGEFKEIRDGQGYACNSSWSRGQAWAIYGFVLSYVYTKDIKYLDTAKSVANYFIAACCDDYLPKCDFRSPAQPIYFDASAAMIAVCGLLEISENAFEFEGDMYKNAAMRFIKANVEKFGDWSENTDGLLGGSASAYHFGEKNVGFIYGDYFLIEAIQRLKGIYKLIW